MPDVLPTPVSSDKNPGLHKGGYEVTRSGAVVSVEGHYKPGLVKMAQLQILPTPTSCNVVHPSAEAEATEGGNMRRVRADGTPFTLGLADLAHRGALPTPRASDADAGMGRGCVVKGGSVRSGGGMTAGLEEEARLGLLPTPVATNSKGGEREERPSPPGREPGGPPARPLPRPGFENFPSQPPLCGGDDGLSVGLARTPLYGGRGTRWVAESLRALGNAWVPQVAYEIFRSIGAVD